MEATTDVFPFEIKNITLEESVEIHKHFDKRKHAGFVRVGPKGYFFPKGITNMAPKIYNMELRPDDSWVLSYPKSGTTWTQELVWLIVNDCDFEKAKNFPLVARFPFLEMSMLLSDEIKATLPKDGDKESLKAFAQSFEYVSDFPSPRFIKCHMPLSLLPPSLLDTCRVVYVARDPRDVAISYYHHSLFFKHSALQTDFKSYWNLFLKDMISWTPYFGNVKEAWEKRHHPNMLFLFYDELKKDFPSVIEKVAKFFGKTVTEEQNRRLRDHFSFENFKKNKSVNMDVTKEFDLAHKNESFMREGKSGGWRESFDEEMMQQAERWMADNLRDTELRFPTK